MRSLLVVLVVAALAPQARADDQEDHVKADQLFEQAQAAKEAGDTAKACELFDQALKSNKNAVGTLLNVAKCSEDAGKFATAVKLYTQARDIAREHNLDEHRQAAQSRLDQISGRVPQLAIAFTERLDNMKLVIDDEVYPTDPALTSALQLDPGPRHIVVTAPGRLPYETSVTLVEGKPAAIAIPKLGHPVTVKKARRTVGKILTFSGAGMAVTGMILGYIANRDFEREVGGPNSGKPCIKETPDAKPLCTAEGYQRTGEAHQLGTTGTIVGIVGGAALATGLALWLTAPAEHADRVSIVPSIGSDSAGLAAVGRF